MTIEQIQKNASYLFYCKDNYLKGIRPGDPNSKNKDGYKNLLEIAELYFESNLLDTFAGYLIEGHYLVQLWTAHLILEHGQPDDKLKERCLDEIRNYARDNPLAPDVSIQERIWLENYLKTKRYHQ
ncbi:MAG: hypothetical protein CFE21_09230 [Bacteroidetes bacterium B1(2017)]|nr:MAG: hypothetical protein CFE21_09230 [Bacteroidetes bacterium B1(2017)]